MINSDTPNTTQTASQEIDDLCLQLTKMRGNTLLVMYYPDDRGQMSEELNGLKRGFDKVMLMYTIAFYAGIILIGVSVISAFLPPTFKVENNLTLFGAIGATNIVSSFIFKPATDLQNSRANSVVLNTTYFTWLNDLALWSWYLRSLSKGKTTGDFEHVGFAL